MFKNSTYKRGLTPVGSLGLIVVVLAVFAGGYLTGVNNGTASPSELHNAEAPAGVDFGAYWKAWALLDEKYVPTSGNGTSTTATTTTAQDKVWRSIEGLAKAYDDPYTVFFPPAEKAVFETSIKGNFEGVGMEVGIRDGVLTIVSPLKDSPAAKAGLKPGDKIVQIGDLSTADMTVEEAVTHIRGPKGTTVTLTIYREKETSSREISVVRDVINLPTLDTKIIGEGSQKVYLISLYSFSENSPTLFRDALIQFANSGTNKLIIDLRGNPGGYLEAAVDMASYFLPEGKVVVREYFGPNKDEDIHRSKGHVVFSTQPKVAILINAGSASASEILAGALAEQGVATLVGEKTFGKGSVQELVEITKDTSLKVTVARWLTPNGKSISKSGLEPDVKVELTQAEFEKGVDTQLNKAVEVLNSN